MSQKDYKTLLEFTDRWFTLGILTEEKLQQYGTTYETSADKNTEHYRYGAFRWYLNEHRPLSASVAEALYALGASDPDPAMGEAIMADIIGLAECPPSAVAKALASGRQHLVRAAKRRSLLSELRQAPLTDELFSQCIEGGDRVIHLALMEQNSLTKEQLSVLAEQGINHAIRNMASDKLRNLHMLKLEAPQK